MRRLSSLMTLILVASVLLIGGVSAAWIYATGDPTGDSTDANIGMGEWDFGYTLSFRNEDRTFLEKQMNQGDTIDLASTTVGSPIYTLWEQIKGFQESNPGDLEVDYSSFDTSTVESFKENHFDYWINTGSTRIDSIESDRTEDLVLFPTFKNLYNAIFVDLDGNILNWTAFSATNAGYNKVKTLGESVTAPDLTSQSMTFVSWEVKETDADGNNVASYALDNLNTSNFGETDITIYPVYQYNGTASLVPVDSDGDGDTDYYEVDGYSGGQGSNLVEIPNNLNGIETTQINAEAFSSFDDLYAVKIPSTVTTVENKAFADRSWTSWGRDTVTLYVELDLSDPNNLESVTDNDWTNALDGDDSTTTDLTLVDGWDYNMGDGSRIFFLKNGKVDNTGPARTQYHAGICRFISLLYPLHGPAQYRSIGIGKG